MCFKNSNPAAVWGVVLKSTEDSVIKSVAVLEKHNITPKSIWLGVGFEILRNVMLPFFILLDPIISNLMGMAQTPICTPPKASPGNGGQLVFLKGFCIPCFMPFHVPGSYRHFCFQKGKYWRDYKLKHRDKHNFFFYLQPRLMPRR